MAIGYNESQRAIKESNEAEKIIQEATAAIRNYKNIEFQKLKELIQSLKRKDTLGIQKTFPELFNRLKKTLTDLQKVYIKKENEEGV
jgi:uncharacterized protein YcbK (DUF882 family)